MDALLLLAALGAVLLVAKRDQVQHWICYILHPRAGFVQVQGKRTALVTGGGSGIGKCVVKELLSNGWHVHTCDINQAGLVTLESECKGSARLTTHACDITDAAACAKMVHEITAAGKQSGAPLAALANVAGLLRALPFAECTDAEIEKTMAVNFYGPCRLARLCMPALLEAPGYGTILSVSSVGGRDAWPWNGAYAASKHALEGAMDAIRREALASKLPLRVVLVEPAAVDTPMAVLQPDNGVKWCKQHPESVFAPTMEASCSFNSKMMAKGWTPSSLYLGFTPNEVAGMIVLALSTAAPLGRYVAARGPFLLLWRLALWLPTHAGDQIMAHV